ncbi:cyclin-dependent kinases regulatory subunit 1 isoform X2 [Passer montanus]|uniref:cyclin-dependent kinases regulatory subunit 1 isoform X2 n=1 Tax=Passer montanus TaxID=9160 RepID=UPI00195F8BB9|nr:cyclin-dependent kinases regulatory subunit 1 isoform X2 [Passer montanus]
MRQTQSASKPIPALLRALSRREQGPSVAASATQATCGRRAAAVGSGGSSDAETTPALAASWNTGTCSPLRAQISPGGPAGGRGGRPGAGYRHVMLPKDIAKLVPKTHLLSESEWRNLGVQQSQGWVHYMIHEPEPHILLFRRPLPKKPEK